MSEYERNVLNAFLRLPIEMQEAIADLCGGDDVEDRESGSEYPN